MTTRMTLIVSTTVALAAGISLFLFTQNRALAPVQNTATTTPQTESAAAGGSGTATSQPGVQKPTLLTPDYQKPIAFSADIAADIREQLSASATKAQADIKKNPLDVRAWINLGTYHKMGGDYKAAAEYWEFVASFYSGSSAPNYALGDLYQNFIKDYTKAEVYYLAAIKSNPRNVDAYASLYRLYRYQVGDQAKAAAILEQGLKANPGNNYLESLDD